nr:immunoglobulin heavy chain junction region [Mus musculus]MBK4189963.1 immunoglobulin heavy chain junction region [Mus musculus]MBK4189964.1 immunoglobulin heavy chain junction region [Mus musculus]
CARGYYDYDAWFAYW